MKQAAKAVNSDPLVGHSVPDFELTDGTKVGELLRNGKGLLLDFDAHAPLQAVAARWGDRLSYVAGKAKNRLGLNAVLVRPDGIVAWTSQTTGDNDEATQAALRWFGEPQEA